MYATGRASRPQTKMAGLAEMTPVHVRETRAGARSRKSTSPKPNGGTGGGGGGQNGKGGSKTRRGEEGEGRGQPRGLAGEGGKQPADHRGTAPYRFSGPTRQVPQWPARCRPKRGEGQGEEEAEKRNRSCSWLAVAVVEVIALLGGWWLWRLSSSSY